MFENSTIFPVCYQPNFLTPAEADRLLEHSLALNWRQYYSNMYGKRRPNPRLEAVYGDAGCSYQYRNIILDPEPWTDTLTVLRKRVEAETWYRFNIVIGNRYSDGSQHIGYHSDDSPEMGANPVIASISLGATRRFSVRDKRTKETISFDLEHGSLITMLPGCQTTHVHKLHKTAKPCGLRINWTFRPHVGAGQGVLSA